MANVHFKLQLSGGGGSSLITDRHCSLVVDGGDCIDVGMTRRCGSMMISNT
jgi:hypothetical protein